MAIPPKLLIVGQLPPPYHGSNVMAEFFISSLIKLGFKVAIAEKAFSKTLLEMGSYSLRRFIRAQVIFFKIIRILITTRPKLCFYFISIKPPSIYLDMIFLLLLRILKAKTILYIHGQGFKKISEQFPLVKFFFKNPKISALKGALVLCEKLKKDIEFCIPEDQIFVLPNYIPDVNPEVMSVYCKTKTWSDKLCILHLSNLRAAKGTIEFLKMARIVIDNGKNVRFVLAGEATSASFRKKIEQLISDLRLRDNVEMVGAVYGSAKERLFYESDIFVFPTHNEAHPLVNLEAMRAGLPIISSNEGCIPEMIIDGFNGYIVDPKDVEEISDRVLKLVNNDQLRIKMGKAGRKIYEKYFTKNVYEKKVQEGVNYFLRIAGL
jgi:glycosyltransferase involved in cell wall biosynthesis